MSAHITNILSVSFKNVFVRPLQKDVPAGRSCLPVWIFLDDIFVKYYLNAIEIYCSSFPAPTVENAPTRFSHITGPLLLPLAKKLIREKKTENKINKLTLKRKLQSLKDNGGFNIESPHQQDVLLIVAKQKKAEENLAFAKLMSITSCDDIINAITFPEKENVVFEEVSLNSLPAYLRKELKDNHDKIISALRDPSNNVLHTDPYWLANHVGQYYEKLFAPKYSAGIEAINLFLKRAKLSFIPSELYEELGEDYTCGEFDHILSLMDKEKTHTSPGPDGNLTRLFSFSTKALRPIFAKLFADMANYIIKYDQLPDCFIDLLIRILGKPGKDLADIKSYRPIALMQICLRIICKWPTNRLLRVLHLFIDHQQLAYIPGSQED